MKVITIWAKRVEKANTYGETEVTIKGTGLTIELLEEVNTHGPMEESMKDSGLTIKCMVGVGTNGRMDESMMGSINSTKNMESDNIKK